jgi:hypothetical protein
VAHAELALGELMGLAPRTTFAASDSDLQAQP